MNEILGCFNPWSYFQRFGDHAKAFIALLIVSIILNIGFGVIVPFIPTYGVSLGATPTQVGFIISAFMLGRIITTPTAGQLSDVIGRKRVMLTGTIAYAVTMALMAFSPRWEYLLFLRFLEGMSVGSVWPIAQAHLVDVVPKERIGEATGIYSSTFSLGFFLGPLAGSGVYFLTIQFGGDNELALRTPFVTTGVLALFASIGILLYVHDVRAFVNPDIDGVLLKEESMILEPESSSHSSMSLEHTILQDVYLDTTINTSLEYKKFYLLAVINGIGVGLIVPIFALYYVKDLGYNEGLIGLVLGVGGGLSMLVSLRAGAMADRVGRKPLLIIGILFMSLTTLFLGFATSILVASIIFWARMVGFGFYFPSFRAHQADVIKPYERGKIFGRSQSLFNVGGFIGPILGTWVYEMYTGNLYDFFGFTFHGGGFPFVLTGIIMFTMIFVAITLQSPFKTKKQIVYTPLRMYE